MLAEVNHIRYLLHQVILSSHPDAGTGRFTISVKDGWITIDCAGNRYTEPLFDFESPELMPGDRDLMHQCCEALEKDETTENWQGLMSLADLEIKNIFRLTQFFCNEKYFLPNAATDHHGRRTLASVRMEVQPFLRFPILDILHNRWLWQMGLPFQQRQQQLFLTCDYDYLSFRHSFTPWKFFRRQAKWLLRLRWDRLYAEVRSRLLSENRTDANPLFLTDMFCVDMDPKQFPENFTLERRAFFLLTATNPRFDFRNSVKGKAAQAFIRELDSRKVICGIHPSYETQGNSGQMRKEIASFEAEMHRPAACSRFHFLRGDTPEDLNNLEASSGVLEEHSLYFTESLVFRAGISKPFHPWNAETGQPSRLLRIPLTLMDCTLDQYLGFSLEAAKKETTAKIRKALLLGSSASLLWHNHYFYPGFYDHSYQAELFQYIARELPRLAGAVKNNDGGGNWY